MTADTLALLARGTLAASAAILVVLALRHPLRTTFGAQVAYAFWLLVPLAILGALLPARTIFVDAAPAIAAPAAPVEAITLGGAQPEATTSAIAPHVVSLPDLAPWLLALWIAGVGFGVAAHIAGQRRCLRNADTAGPALVGVLRPRIVLPVDFAERFTAEERDLVLAHESAHLAAGDAQINALAALLQCLNWFNPLFHVARGALRIDQELACDARVMALHAPARRTYAEAMLKTQISAHAVPLGCQWPPLGAGPLKQRIGMLARPTPTAARRSAGAALCALTAFAAAGVAWIVQPPRVAYAADRQQTAQGRALGAELVRALQQGQMPEARELVEAGADVNYFLIGDGTPLIVAARNGDYAFTQYLIDHGADVNQAAPGDGNALIMAAGGGQIDVVTLLVERGADVNGYVRGDETPLINAAQHNRLDVAAYLMSQGADVNLAVEAPTRSGVETRSPLGEARRRSHAEMIALLTARGARR